MTRHETKGLCPLDSNPNPCGWQQRPPPLPDLQAERFRCESLQTTRQLARPRWRKGMMVRRSRVLSCFCFCAQQKTPTAVFVCDLVHVCSDAFEVAFLALVLCSFMTGRHFSLSLSIYISFCIGPVCSIEDDLIDRRLFAVLRLLSVLVRTVFELPFSFVQVWTLAVWHRYNPTE